MTEKPMTNLLDNLEVGDTIVLRNGERHEVEEIKKRNATFDITTSTKRAGSSLGGEGYRWTHLLCGAWVSDESSPGDIMQVWKNPDCPDFPKIPDDIFGKEKPMTEKDEQRELNILEEPIENLQFRGFSEFELVSLYQASGSNVLVISKNRENRHFTEYVYRNGSVHAKDCPHHMDIIRKKKVVADWFVCLNFSVDDRVRGIRGVFPSAFCRINGRPDEDLKNLDYIESAFKIPGTEREV